MTVHDQLAELLARTEKLQARQAERVKAIKGQSKPDQPRAEAPAVTVDGSTATIRLYDVIDDWGDWWGLSAREFVAELDALPSSVETIIVAINSPGGMVFEAVAIMNALRRHSARVVAIVEGVAASAASFIAASADETIMMPNSQMMIHAAWGYTYGDATDMREYADLLDQLTLSMCEIYADKSGRPASEWLEDMAGVDVWLSAQEAVDAGLADRVGDEPTETDTAASASATSVPQVTATAAATPVADDQPVADEKPWSVVDAELQLLAL